MISGNVYLDAVQAVIDEARGAMGYADAVEVLLTAAAVLAHVEGRSLGELETDLEALFHGADELAHEAMQ